MNVEKFSDEFRERFWNKVRKDFLGCWEWQAYRTRSGYGFLQARKISPFPMLAHRVSWALAFGKIPKGFFVLHKCDNAACVRPSHLFLGTQHDNNLDRDKKGRVASGDRNGARTMPNRNPYVRNRGSGLRGEQHPMSKLTLREVQEIRSKFVTGINRHQLAKEYEISDTHADRIVKNISWRENV